MHLTARAIIVAGTFWVMFAANCGRPEAATLSGPMGDAQPSPPAEVGTRTNSPREDAQPGTPPSEAMITMMIAWLSHTFDLPASEQRPRIEVVPASQMFALRYRLAGRPMPVTVVGSQNPAPADVVALFEDATQTIFLPQGWSGATPGELSVLVHEMVHYLQSRAGLKYICPEERERLAYDAQEKWLNLFGRKLAVEFDTDPFTLLLRTRCSH